MKTKIIIIGLCIGIVLLSGCLDNTEYEEPTEKINVTYEIDKCRKICDQRDKAVKVTYTFECIYVGEENKSWFENQTHTQIVISRPDSYWMKRCAVNKVCETCFCKDVYDPNEIQIQETLFKEDIVNGTYKEIFCVYRATSYNTILKHPINFSEHTKRYILHINNEK